MSEKGPRGAVDHLLADNTVKLVLWFLALVSPIIGGLMVQAGRGIYDTMTRIEIQLVPQVNQLTSDMHEVKTNMAEEKVRTEGMSKDIEWLKDSRRVQ